MTSLAFTFTTKDINYVVLTGTKTSPVLISKGKILLPTNYDIPKTVTWFEKELDLLLNSSQPDCVAYKLTINNVTNSYVSHVYYGQAMLNLLCDKKQIKIEHMAPASIKGTKLGLSKDDNVLEYFEDLVGTQSSPWDKGIKETGIIALLIL